MQTKVSDKLLLYLFFHCQVKVIFSKLICGSMTVALPTPAKSDSCPLTSQCNETKRNQYNGKNARIGKPGDFLKKCGRNRRKQCSKLYICSSPFFLVIVSPWLRSRDFLGFPCHSIRNKMCWEGILDISNISFKLLLFSEGFLKLGRYAGFWMTHLVGMNWPKPAYIIWRWILQYVFIGRLVMLGWWCH